MRVESTFVDWCNNRVTIDVLGALARARDVTLHAFLGLARAVARGDFGRVSFGVGRPEPEELLGEFAILVDVDDVGKMLGLRLKRRLGGLSHLLAIEVGRRLAVGPPTAANPLPLTVFALRPHVVMGAVAEEVCPIAVALTSAGHELDEVALGVAWDLSELPIGRRWVVDSHAYLLWVSLCAGEAGLRVVGGDRKCGGGVAAGDRVGKGAFCRVVVLLDSPVTFAAT